VWTTEQKVKNGTREAGRNKDGFTRVKKTDEKKEMAQGGVLNGMSSV